MLVTDMGRVAKGQRSGWGVVQPEKRGEEGDGGMGWWRVVVKFVYCGRLLVQSSYSFLRGYVLERGPL